MAVRVFGLNLLKNNQSLTQNLLYLGKTIAASGVSSKFV